MSAALRLDDIRARIAKAAALARRNPADVTLIAVTKGRELAEIEPLIEAGQRDFGESRVQEALAKWPLVLDRHPGIRLHAIGRLQSNKADEAVRLFDVIHSLDRTSLLDALVLAAAKEGRTPSVYVQVNIGDEPQKGGCPISGTVDLIEAVRASPLPLKGLMAIPPLGVEPSPVLRAPRQARRSPWRQRPQHGHVGRFRGRGDARRDRRSGRHRLVRGLMARPGALILDFDGVLVDSEQAGNQLLADLLTDLGHPTSLEETYDHYVGLAGRPFFEAVERRIGEPLPPDFIARRRAQGQALLDGGVGEVPGARAFVRSLPKDLPRALASSSSTRWMQGHLAHLGLGNSFVPHLYSGHEHVERGKPEPDLYLFAADKLGVAIADCAIIEDSPIGVRGALASGARVIGFCGGSHCREGHGDRLRAEGVRDIARDFAEVRRLLDL